MNDRYIDGGASLIQLYGWLRETGEIDRLIDLVIEKVRDSRQTEKAKDSEPPLRAENERLREALTTIKLMCASGYYGPFSFTYAMEAKRIAAQALAAPPEEK